MAPDASDELVHRERQYLLLMATRMVAIVVAVVVPGVWRWIAIAAGITIPYLAVVLVNAAKVRGTPADPYFVAPVEQIAIPDTAFEGLIITPDKEA